MYTKEDLPVLIDQLTSSSDENEIKKCCLSAANIAQESLFLK